VLDAALEQRLRRRARELGVSAATLFHVAWAQVLACTTGREQVVFGTVLVGRTQGGAGVQRAVGMFINTLPIRIDIDDSTAEACVRNAHSTLAELLRYENTPLVQAQGCSGVASWLPLFSALLNYRHSTAAGHGELGWQGIEVLWNEERTNYPLSLMVDDLGQRIEMVALTQAPGAPERVCALMVSALAQLVDALDRAPATSIRGIDVLPQSERHVIEAWNAPAGRAGQHCVHELFEAQVARTPDAVALQEGPRQLSYAQLNRRANQLARYLRSVGVGPEERVALCMERSIDLVVAVLGVLKSGGAYVALEPSYLAVRLQHILEDAAPRLLLTQRALSGVLTSNVAVFEVDADWDVVARLEDSNLPVSELGLTPAHLAYVTYTSGSTGRPKGVMSDHARTINRLVAQVEIAPLAVGEVCAQKTSIGFVDAVFETLHPLLAGAKLVVLANSITADARQLAAAVSTYRVTRWITVPSLASALLQDAQCVQQLQGLRYWLLSGEALSAALLRQLRQQLPQCCFINIYGSSECADATYYVGGSVADESTVPIGRPLVNTRVYILDAQRALVPVGVVGEIHLGGASLAGGYLNLPELTAQRFLTDPFSGEADARMYRTGDLGRWRADGMIEYLGRDDHQVKIRGFRIELGEIEACLRGLAQVSDVVVVARESQAEERRLVAYYVSAAQVGAQALRTHVAAALPSYMVPAAYVRLASLPLTPNGKLDRAALPAPDSGAYGRQGYEAPQGEMETQLAQLWMQLLEVESVGRRDNFFELGGHSLSVMSLTQVLKLQLQVDLSVRDVFEHPKLTQLAERVTEVMLEQFDPEELNALECETAVEAGY
jgi:amino acid adenylation domain-containing protein